jgi:hypothetical protein
VLGDRRLPPWLPWALCWTAWGLLLPAEWLRLAYPEEAEDTVFYAVIQLVGVAMVPLVGALIAARQPSNPYGWLWCALGLVYASLAITDGLRRSGAIPGWAGRTLVAALLQVILCLLVLVLLLFPSGRQPSPAWRWVPRATVLLAAVVVVILPFAPPADDGGEPGPLTAGGRVGDLLVDVPDRSTQVLFLLVVAAAASVLVRFRRAGPVERQQLKWFLFSAGLASAVFVLELLRVPLGDAVWALVDAVAFFFLPVSVGIAVLRYRLYEIDRIVSRTVSYGLLSAALIGMYLLVVALLRPLLEPLTGGSALAVAGSTLAVAGAFNPARRRLQEAVDRRFDRARYDAVRAVDAFAARLRTQVDLDTVTAGLRDTVVATVAPTRFAVWLRDVPATRQAARARP